MTGDPPLPEPPVGRSATTAMLTRGVRRRLTQMGHSTVTELRLASGRRADVVSLDRKGLITIVEIKSGVDDLRADSKWPDYLDYCDCFYFGVATGFPLSQLPEGAGIIIADAWDGFVHRYSPHAPLSGARRKAMMLRFAQTATQRLLRFEDPDALMTLGTTCPES